MNSNFSYTVLKYHDLGCYEAFDKYFENVESGKHSLRCYLADLELAGYDIMKVSKNNYSCLLDNDLIEIFYCY